MKKINLITVEDILGFAITNEENAINFYKGLAKNVDDSEVKNTIEDFASEEEQHKGKLEMVKEDKMYLPEKREDMEDVNLEMEVEEEEIDTDSEVSLEKAYKLAMQREIESFELYNRLAESIDDSETEEILNNLAQEEANHKMFFEREYEEHFS